MGRAGERASLAAHGFEVIQSFSSAWPLQKFPKATEGREMVQKGLVLSFILWTSLSLEKGKTDVFRQEDIQEQLPSTLSTILIPFPAILEDAPSTAAPLTSPISLTSTPHPSRILPPAGSPTSLRYPPKSHNAYIARSVGIGLGVTVFCIIVVVLIVLRVKRKQGRQIREMNPRIGHRTRRGGMDVVKEMASVGWAAERTRKERGGGTRR